MTASQVRLTATGERVAVIARSTETVSLDLLRAIDDTVDAMNGVAAVVTGFGTLLSGIVDEISAIDVIEDEYIDPEDVITETLARAANELKVYLPALVRRRAAIDDDPRLCDLHCEALHDAYEKAIDAVAELIEAVQSARASIISHDLRAEPRSCPESFSTVDALIANLHRE